MIYIAAIGVGNRTGKYLRYFKGRENNVRITAIVEPNPIRAQAALKEFPTAQHYSTSEEFFQNYNGPCDGVIIASPDKFHYEQTIQAINKSYNVLVEKPIAQSYQQCQAIAKAAQQQNVIVAVCYVLRFMPLYRKIKELIDAGVIGQLTEVSHTVHVGKDRMMHTFVRGYWNKADETTPSFISKCCHDLDMLLWLTGSKVTDIQSEGSLTFYRPENAPENAATRCINCKTETTCPYSAVDMYLRRNAWTDNFPVPEGKAKTEVLENELKTGRFGKCAFKAGNDVADYQTATLKAGPLTIKITMDGVSHKDGRNTIINGTKGRLETDGRTLKIIGPQTKILDFSKDAAMPLHANADLALVEDFVNAIKEDRQPEVPIGEALESHRIGFIAG